LGTVRAELGLWMKTEEDVSTMRQHTSKTRAVKSILVF
jgi:hypothetical protein